MKDIKEVWRRIEELEGEEFRQIRGQRFSYSVAGNAIVPSTTRWNIPKGDFEKALHLVPLKNTVPVQHLQGPSYVYAIMMGPRLRRGDW
jgi:hypothetical protein